MVLLSLIQLRGFYIGKYLKTFYLNFTETGDTNMRGQISKTKFVKLITELNYRCFYQLQAVSIVWLVDCDCHILIGSL